MLNFDPLLVAISKTATGTTVAAQYKYHLGNLEEMFKKGSPEEKAIDNYGTKQVVQERHTSVKIKTEENWSEEKNMTTLSFYTYKRNEKNEIILKSVINAYFIGNTLIDDSNKNDYLPARYLNDKGELVELKHPTNKINFNSPNNAIPGTVTDTEKGEARKLKAKAESESSRTGDSMRKPDAKEAEGPGEGVFAAETAKSVASINFIKSLIKSDATKEYEAGGQIKVAIPQDKRNQIPAEGISATFRFPGSEEKTEVKIEQDTEEFYINVPSDLKPGRNYSLMGAVGGVERTIKNITIKTAAVQEQQQGGSASGAPAAEATAKAGLLKTIQNKISVVIGDEYKAGEQIKVIVPEDVKSIIPEGGVKFKFQGGAADQEATLLRDMNEFYITVPTNLAANQNHQLIASIGEQNQFIKYIKVNPADAAPGADKSQAVSGVNDSTWTLPLPRIKMEFVSNGKVVADRKKWRVKPGKIVTFRLTLIDKDGNELKENIYKQNIPVYARLYEDGAKAKGNDIPEVIPSSSNFVDISVTVPVDYTAEKAVLLVHINPEMRNGKWIADDSDLMPSYGSSQPLPTARPRPELLRFAELDSFIVDTTAGEIPVKPKSIKVRGVNEKTKKFDNISKNYNVPWLSDNSHLPGDGGYYTRTDNPEELELGLYKNLSLPPSCSSSADLKKYAINSILPYKNKCGFEGLTITKETPDPKNPIDGKDNENDVTMYQHELECRDAAGNTYVVILNTGIEKDKDLGVIQSNIAMRIVQTSNKKINKDISADKEAVDKQMGQLKKANGKFEDLTPPAPAPAPAPAAAAKPAK